VTAHRLYWLFERFRSNDSRSFLVWKDKHFTYKWLLDSISQWHARLEDSKVPNGTVVAIEGDYSPQAVALFLALVERGAIIVPLTASVGAPRAEFRAIAEVQVVITLTADDGAEIVQLSSGEVKNELLRKLVEANEPGLVLFSSGSTGKSKAALHNFTLLLKKFHTYRYSLVTLAFLMLDHIGGINTLLYVLSNAGTLVCVESRDPDVVCAAIEQHGVELLPTSPTFLNLLLISEAYNRHSLSSLKRITYGTEVMPQRTLERLHQLLPDVELQQTYGLSEIGI
jgi:acyl-coenzyme A synthetase/AMP-(fatty) acid ligase